MRKTPRNNECGTVMIEGVFGVFVSIIVMVLLIAFGFYAYQQTMFDIVANEIAEEIVMTYKYRNAEDCSSITFDDVKKPGRYRFLIFGGKYDSANESKGATLASARLAKTTLAQPCGEPTVEIKKVGSDIGRMHYEVTLTQTYKYLMGDLLNMLGIPGTQTVSKTVYVESVDISNYFNTVKLANYGANKAKGLNPFLEALNSITKLMKSVYDLFT